jgi:hypothetical protein
MIPLLLAYVVVSGPGSLIWWIVGLVLVFAILFYLLRALSAPPVLYTVLYIVLALVALAVVLDCFFGGAPGGAVIVR